MTSQPGADVERVASLLTDVRIFLVNYADRAYWHKALTLLARVDAALPSLTSEYERGRREMKEEAAAIIREAADDCSIGQSGQEAASMLREAADGIEAIPQAPQPPEET